VNPAPRSGKHGINEYDWEQPDAGRAADGLDGQFAVEAFDHKPPLTPGGDLLQDRLRVAQEGLDVRPHLLLQQVTADRHAIDRGPRFVFSGHTRLRMSS
jgi:hypothetical protein